MAGEAEPRLTRKGRATYDRIVQSAADQMFERGVARTSTEDIRVGAFVSNSQLYHYFADKNALVRAVISYQTRQVLASHEPFFRHLDFQALAAWRDRVVRVQSGSRCPLGSLANELNDTDAGARRLLADGFARWAAALSQGLRGMRDRGELSPEADHDQLALNTLAALQGGLLLSSTLQDPAPLEASLDLAIGCISRYAAVPV